MGQPINMMFFLFAFLTVPAQADNWSYDGAMRCLGALTSTGPAAQAPIPFNRDAIGIARGIHEQADGFFILTAKAVFFVPAAEGAKSAGSDESKITVRVPGVTGSPIKFFFKGATSGDRRVNFAIANEFDRQVEGQPVETTLVQGILNRAIGKAFTAATAQAKTQPSALHKAIETCEGTQVDFALAGAKGDSTLRDEMQKWKAKVQPSVFSKEYWLRKKEGAG